MGMRWDDEGPGRSASLDHDRMMIARAWKRATEIVSDITDCGDLFGAPPWRMMLETYIAHREHRRLSTTSALTASGAPSSSAARYLTVLIDRGLLRTSPDLHDARRRFVGITDTGITRIEEALDRAADSDRALGLTRLHSVK